VTQEHVYLYLYYYASPELRSRLYLGLPNPNDSTLGAYRLSSLWFHLDDLRATSFSSFFATRRDFYVYSPIDGVQNGTCEDCLQQFLDAGYTLRAVDRDTDHLLEYFSK
jgi:hypothetical protein